MNVAVKRFVFVTLVLAMSVFCAWGYLRAKGQNSPSKAPLNTLFLQKALPAIGQGPVDLVIYHPFGETGPQYYTAERLQSLASEPAEFALWLDVHPLMDGSLVVGTTLMDTQAAVPLAQALALVGSRRLVLNVFGYRAGMLDNLTHIIEAAKASDRILVQSPEDGFMKDARTDQPLWLFGASQTQVTLMVMMSSIGLESTSPFRGDVFVMEGDASDRPLLRLSDEMINEVHRRGRKIYAGPAQPNEALKLSLRGVDGILSAHPGEIARELHHASR